MPSGHIPTLVFIHGSGDSAHEWDHVIADLADVDCLALDLPGHGARRDDRGPDVMSVEDYAWDVRRELERRQIQGARVVGHSLGGAIALRLALDHADLISGVALVGAGSRMRVLPALLEEARTDQAATLKRLAEIGFAPGHETLSERHLSELEPTAPGMLHRDLVACDGFDCTPDLGRIGLPTLILTGEEDRLTPPKYARFLQERIPGATLTLFPRCGHFLPNEAPERLAGALRAWLAASQ